MNLKNLNDTDIIAGNKLIAEFMGAKVVEVSKTYEILDMGKDRIQNTTFWNTKSLKYHKDPSWIFPVIEKLENLFIVENKQLKYYKMLICGRECQIYINNTIIAFEDQNIKIINIWKCIIDFINYYNSINK